LFVEELHHQHHICDQLQGMQNPSKKFDARNFKRAKKIHFFMILKGFQSDMEDQIVKTSD
jgi:hypothetical protein